MCKSSPMADSPRVLTARVKPSDDGTTVLVEFGRVELERKIPENQGIIRMSFILDAAGKLSDVELVTEKSEI
jgi:hypothetical protein